MVWELLENAALFTVPSLPTLAVLPSKNPRPARTLGSVFAARTSRKSRPADPQMSLVNTRRAVAPPENNTEAETCVGVAPVLNALILSRTLFKESDAAIVIT